MSQAETDPTREETTRPAKRDDPVLFVRVSLTEKGQAETEVELGGFRSVADWARQKLFYGWKKPGDEG